jgi:hypothetical protein
LVKSFKLVSKPLDKGPDQDKSNCDLVYMASFWRENQIGIDPKKKTLKESSWFGEPLVS